MPRSKPAKPLRKITANINEDQYRKIEELKEKITLPRKPTRTEALRIILQKGIEALEGELKGKSTSIIPLFSLWLVEGLRNMPTQALWLQAFLWALAGLGALALAFTVIYACKFGFGPLIMRAEAPEERARAQRVLAGCLVGGVCLVLARPIASWITGISLGTDPTTGEKIFFKDKNGNGQYDSGTDERLDMPSGLADVADKLLLFLTVIGALVLVVGIMWGGIQLAGRVGARRS